MAHGHIGIIGFGAFFLEDLNWLGTPGVDPEGNGGKRKDKITQAESKTKNK